MGKWVRGCVRKFVHVSVRGVVDRIRLSDVFEVCFKAVLARVC